MSQKPPAPHLQAALARTVQAKLPGRPPQAEHVRRALAPAQAKLPEPPSPARPPAPHVRSATAVVQRQVAVRPAGLQRLEAGAPRRAAPSAPGVQSPRSGFKPALPPGLETKFSVDDITPDSTIAAFVDTVKRPDWYRSDEADKDTKEQLLARSTKQTFTGLNGPEIFFQCASCKKWFPYEAVEIG